jgi:hypothetical protein
LINQQPGGTSIALEKYGKIEAAGLPTHPESGGEMDSNVGASEQASSVDSKVAILVQDNVENDTITSVKHPASEHLALAWYIAKYPALFVPEFLGTVDKQHNRGTTENAEDDSAGTSIIGRMVNSDMVETSPLVSLWKNCMPLIALQNNFWVVVQVVQAQCRNPKKRTERDGKKWGYLQFHCCRHQNLHRIPWWKD